MNVKQLKNSIQMRCDNIASPVSGQSTLASYVEAIGCNIENENFLTAQDLCYSLIRLLGEADEKQKFLRMLGDIE